MNHVKILFLFIALFSCAGLQAQCPPGTNEIRLEIDTDDFWYEVTWHIIDFRTGIIYVSGSVPDDSLHVFTYCIPDDGCKNFSINDVAGDGMFPDGYYKVYLNGTLIHQNTAGNFFFGEYFNFSCPPGTDCTNTLPVDTGAWVTPSASETWYRFVPADTAIYEISTCDSLNTCGSKIWVYSQCEGILINENQTGAIFYADGGCDNGAVATLYLAGGQDYFIRLRYEPVFCDTTPLHFNLTYLGPISGCPDPLSCNYNPLATVAAPCIYPGDPNCPNRPDLVTRQDVFRSTLKFSSMDNASSCAVEEGCIRGLGNRYLLEFSTFIENTGEKDYHIGAPPTDITAPSEQFIWDPCHQHWHYVGYAEYVLFDANGVRIPIGSKVGFCVLDLFCQDQENKKFTCEYMGISAGCADIYDVGLPCQWIDITDIPAGDYTLVMRVNWDKSPDGLGNYESNYENNWAQACFTLVYDGTHPEVVFRNDQCQPFTDCAGEVLGDAQPDCNGICKGPALRGDWNQDTIRNSSDIEQYLASANADNGDASSCLDLDGNGFIDVYDAALLQECNIHGDDQQYWVQAFPCQFPKGFNNTQDLVSILPGEIDTTAKTFDIQIVNPYNRILGYEFSVSGLLIDSVENLTPEMNADLRFNAANGEIVALGLDESVMNKHALPVNFLRIHYSELVSAKVCVDKITAVVNSKYQLSHATLGNPNCIQVLTSAVKTPDNAAFGVYVQPNPFIEKTSIFFENPAAEPMRVELRDVTGKLLRSFEGIRDTSVTIERGKLPSGTYFFTVFGEKGSASGKVIAQ